MNAQDISEALRAGQERRRRREAREALSHVSQEQQSYAVFAAGIALAKWHGKRQANWKGHRQLSLFSHA